MFPTITTDRLTLRQLKFDDDQEIFFLRSDESILKYLDMPPAATIEDARKFIDKILNGDNLYWAITLKGESKLIGTICIWNISEDGIAADIGYVLHPDYQGKGYMQEAFLKIVEYGFETMKLKTIDADVDPNNLKSIQLLVKNGFVLTKQFDKTVIYSYKRINKKIQ
jgi:ribosomal-protein-alanine N-acetyltransferase